MNIERDTIYWFIHDISHAPLGLIRTTNGGALVIGGKTGSHFTGHGENYWKKLKELIALGYIPLATAKELSIAPPDWTPPPLSPSDREFVEKIIRKEI